MRVRPYGHEASIIDRLAHSTAASLRDTVLDACTSAGLRCIDVVPAATSLVGNDEARDGEAIRRVLASITDRGPVVTRTMGPLIEIAVRYNGADLADVARACSLSVERIISLHSDAEYEVSFCGFAPGFAYLTGLPSELHLHIRPCTRANLRVAGTFSARPKRRCGTSHEHRQPSCNLAHEFGS
ncbi:MAG: carboxyltransferase domain-containing protein [Actinobacteria bacterium]|nr:carboxyltransferase domain-containing protein [Actinomycetota bacterium]